MMRSRLVSCLATVLFAEATLFAGTSKLSPDLVALLSSSSSPPSKIDVIVQFATATTSAAMNNMAAGGSLKKYWPVLHMACLNLPPQAIEALTHSSNVKYISPNRSLQGKLEFAEPTTTANIALQYGYDGTGVGVAIIDSGITASNDFNAGNGASRVVYAESFLPNDSSTNDAYGHGTHVAGIVGGNAANSSGPNAIHTFRGIAPNSNLINLRVLDASGSGSDASLLEAIDRTIALRSRYNIRVMNISAGRGLMESYRVDPLCQAVEQAWKAGIVVVAAAGNAGRDNSNSNQGYGTIVSPGNDPYVITVGAMNDESTVARNDDMMATYSSKGPSAVDHIVKPDLVAPGNKIVSVLAPGNTLASEYPADVVPESYYTTAPTGASHYLRLSGTSMATPMVAGAAALLLQKDPTLSPDTVKARLMKTATKNFPASSTITDPTVNLTFTVYYDLFTVGAGYLDVWDALNDTNDVVPPGLNANSPTAVFDTASNTVSVVNAANAIWGNNVLLANNVVWGSSVMPSDGIISGDAIVWGSSGVEGCAIIWGTAIVWGSSNPFSMSIENVGE